MSGMKVVLFKTSRIRVDENGLVCLNDIHKAAGFRKNQGPYEWLRLPMAQRDIAAALEKVTGKSRNWSKAEMNSVQYTKRGVGTWAIENIALGYAAYLDANLAFEIRDVFLRYKAADPALADEILEKATPEANEWAGTRALGRVARKEYVDTLIAHEVSAPGIGSCTNGIYQGLFQTTAEGLRKQLGVKSGSPRDKFSTAQLAYTMAAEMLAKEDITESNHRGDKMCRRASVDAAKAIGDAIAQNRAERKRQGTLAV